MHSAQTPSQRLCSTVSTLGTLARGLECADSVPAADRIVLGTEKGALVIFDLSNPSSRTSRASAPPPSATFVARHDRFVPHKIDQLAVIKELNALVCLAGGDLTLHSLPDLNLLSSFAPQTKGAGSNFALHTEIRHGVEAEGGVPTIRTTLALACKRRLILLSWVDGTTWNPLVEVALPHQIRSMAFVDASAGGTSTAATAAEPTKIVAGFSTGEYGIVTLPTPDLKGAIKSPVLGDLFSLPIPLSERNATTTASGAVPSSSATRAAGLATGLGGGLRSLGGALGGALARKLDKNGVAKVPRVPRRPLYRRGPGGVESKGEDDENVVKRWLWGEEWGWTDEANSGEVLVVRDSESLPANAVFSILSYSSCLAYRPGRAATFERQTTPCVLPCLLQSDHHLPRRGRRSARLPTLYHLARLSESCLSRIDNSGSFGPAALYP